MHRKLVLLSSLFLSLLPTTLFAQCPAGSTIPSVHICSPTNGSTVGTEVTVTATAASSASISAMKVYVDGVSDYTFHDSSINIDLILQPGTHKLTVKAWDSAGAVFSSSLTVTASDNPPPPPPGGSCSAGSLETVNLCAPASGSTVASPVDVEAYVNSSQTIKATKIYIDGTSVWSGTSPQVSASLSMATGTHKITVKGWKSDNTVLAKSATFTVGTSSGGGGGTGTCTGGSAETMKVCSPASGSTVPSPVDVEAKVTTSSTVTATKIYVDGTSVWSGTSATISANLNIAAGAHKITVKGWLKSGSVLASSVNFTVGTGTTPPPSGFAIIPSNFVTTPRVPVQFSATGATSWAVDGVSGGNTTIGTIDSTGLYTPGSDAPSLHSIQATDGTNNASTTIYIGALSAVTTYKYDIRRTGANTNETILSPSNVNGSHFGKLASFPVDGWVIGQPIYMAGVSVPSAGNRDLVFVATSHDSVYAFDADGKQSSPVWHRSFLDASEGISTFPPVDACCVSEVGIGSTMVIDTASQTLYVVAATKESTGYFYHLHALALATGAELPGSPTLIDATAAGTGDASTNGTVRFDAHYHMQRPALLLSNGALYIGFGSFNDVRPYHGWLLAYDAQTLQQIAAWCVTPNGHDGGIWGSGGGPAADEAGNIYITTGNGTNNLTTGMTDYSMTVMKMDHYLNTIDWFLPYNWQNLNQYDRDFGSSEVILLPTVPTGAPSHLLATLDKNANLYLIDYDQLGHFHASDNSQIFQAIPGNATNLIRGTPAFWNQSFYYGALDSPLVRLSMTSTGFNSSPSSETSTTFAYPGTSPVVSANGLTNGIVWATKHSGGPAVLYAFDANNLGKVLWESDSSSRDTADTSVRFAVPLIANGRVYLAGKTQLVIYGLLP